MTTPATTRPEPVVDAAKLGGLIAAVIVAVLGTVALIGQGKAGDLNALGATLEGLLVAVLALAAYGAQLAQAYKARAKVTPVEDPYDAAGNPLVAELDPPGEHAAPE